MWSCQLVTFKQEVLVLSDVDYDFLISRQMVKKTMMNLLCTNEGTFGERSQRILRVLAELNQESVRKLYPQVVATGDYPLTVSFFEVPFVVETDVPITKKPYALPWAKKEWLDKKLAVMLKDGIFFFK